MSFLPPNASSPVPAATRTRIKWENLMLAGIVVVALVLGCVAVIASTASSPKPTVAEAEELVDPATSDIDADVAGVRSGSELTLDDAIGLVEEARQLMTEGRWDESMDRLGTIPADLAETSGAVALKSEVEQSRASYDKLMQQFDAAVQARRWNAADELYRRMALIAEPNDELLAAHAVVTSALRAPEVEAEAKDDAKPASATGQSTSTSTSTSGGGAASAGARPQGQGQGQGSAAGSTSSASNGQAQPAASKPAASKPAASKPAASAPAASKPGAGSPAASSGSGASNDPTAAGALGGLDVELTSQQQAAVDAALSQLK